MFEKILIANRGEIACRIIDTCRRIGVATVAVYSDADAGARHVRLADEGVRIGPAAAAESYLAIGRIIEAARDSGAEAIHPGYGFLAENADFARSVEAAGLVFIGPRPETIEAMGSKARAKTIMGDAGVPLVPGYHGEAQDDETLAAQAEYIGFPLMLKAAAGGGGKGMRIVRAAGEFAEALGAARREAKGAFGDETMILERYLERPRHIEAQIFGDAHGTVIHLFERDCSSQRRHQKVIEEAPAPNLGPELRAGLLEAAVRAGQAVDYRGAGTVEFLVDGGEFSFLEMNTRLQVEHPVTELITGEDLVEWQLRVAAGEPLPRRQEEIRATRHAMEARIYAEDPERNFLPGSGRIRRLLFPDGEHIRIDTGVEAGDAVSVHYDPMIAKLVVSAADRDRCRSALCAALARTCVDGLVTNLGFLQQLAAAAAFVEGRVDTGLLDRALDEILDPDAPAPKAVTAAAACFWLMRQESARSRSLWARADGWRLGEPAWRKLDLEVGRERLMVEGRGQASAGYELNWLGEGRAVEPVRAQLTLTAAGEASLQLDGRDCRIVLHGDGEVVDMTHAGRRWRVRRHTRFEAVAEAGAGGGRIVAPMPGKVIQVRATEGEEVAEGQVLAIMEAMKMELSIKAPAAGRVAAVSVAEGDVVEADAVLMEVRGA